MGVNLVDKHKRKQAINMLCDKYKVNRAMGELFVNEILVTWYEVPEHMRLATKELGLFDAKRAKTVNPKGENYDAK